MRQIRTFAVVEDGTGDRPLVFDPLTGAAHRGPQPLPRGRVAMDDQQVTGWPEERRAPLLAVSAPSRTFTDAHVALPALGQASIVAVNLLATGPDETLVRSARLLHRAGLLVTVTTNRPGLPRLAEDLAGVVHALRVRLHAPTEFEHDTLALPHQASYQQSLSGIRAAIDAGLPVQLLVEAPPPTVGDAGRLLLVDAAVHRAAQLGVCGLTLLPGPGSLAGRSTARGAARALEVRAHLLHRRSSTGLRVPVRIGVGRAERPASRVGTLAELGTATAAAEVA
ncbi:hypothetical protein ACFYNO_15085 [Kitasatospora sp. NPDC006697]|uniref:hypothetical protein n=1 Tax=unclassified Kitasatospora TaxID=2633591 RepID=UPI00368482D4